METGSNAPYMKVNAHQTGFGQELGQELGQVLRQELRQVLRQETQTGIFDCFFCIFGFRRLRKLTASKVHSGIISSALCMVVNITNIDSYIDYKI